MLELGKVRSSPEGAGETRPRCSVAPKLVHVPVRAAGGEYAALELSVNFIDELHLGGLLDFDYGCSFVYERSHQCMHNIFNLYLAGEQSGVVRREWIRAEPIIQTLIRSRSRKSGVTYKIPKFGKLWTKLPIYACAPRHSFHCWFKETPVLPMTSIGVRNLETWNPVASTIISKSLCSPADPTIPVSSISCMPSCTSSTLGLWSPSR